MMKKGISLASAGGASYLYHHLPQAVALLVRPPPRREQGEAHASEKVVGHGMDGEIRISGMLARYRWQLAIGPLPLHRGCITLTQPVKGRMKLSLITIKQAGVCVYPPLPATLRRRTSAAACASRLNCRLNCLLCSSGTSRNHSASSSGYDRFLILMVMRVDGLERSLDSGWDTLAWGLAVRSYIGREGSCAPTSSEKASPSAQLEGRGPSSHSQVGCAKLATAAALPAQKPSRQGQSHRRVECAHVAQAD